MLMDSQRQPGILPNFSRCDSMLPVPTLTPGSEAALAAARLDSSTSASTRPGMPTHDPSNVVGSQHSTHSRNGTHSITQCRSAPWSTEQQQQQQISTQSHQSSLHDGRRAATAAAAEIGNNLASGRCSASAVSIAEPSKLSADACSTSGRGASAIASNSQGRSYEELKHLVEQTAASIEVKDRKRRLRRHHACFKGRDAVQWWMSTGVVTDEAEALDVGNAMMDAGLVNHVSHQGKAHFSDSSHLYRFHGVSRGADSDDSASGDVSRHRLHRGTEVPPSEPSRGGPSSSSYKASLIQELRGRADDAEAESKVLRLADGVLYEGQLRLARRQRQMMAAVLELAAHAEQQSLAVDTAVLLQTAVLLLLALLLNSLSGTTSESEMLYAGAPSRSTMLNPLLIVGPAVPLVYAIWKKWGARKVDERKDSTKVAAAITADRLSGPMLQRHDYQQRYQDAITHSCSSKDSSSSDRSVDIGSPKNNRNRSLPGTPALHYDDDDLTSSSDDDDPSAPSASAFKGGRDSPGLLRLKPGVGQRLTGQNHDPARLALNNVDGPIEFESEGFVGRAAIWVKGLPSSPPDLFKGKRRRSRLSIQGRFLKRTCMEDVITGQEFSRATNLPAKWLVDQVLIKLAKKINPSVEIGPMSAPSVLVPLIAMSQGVVASKPGEEPDLTGHVTEDARLLDPSLQDSHGGPVSVAKRKSYYGSAARRRESFFETDIVYTFHIFQHLVDLGSYELDLSLYKFDLATYLDGQPLQFMMRERGHTDSPLFSFEMWHEKLLKAAR